MEKLNLGFYERKNVLKIAKELLGKVLTTNFDGIKTSGRIVETEAYNGVIDRASHAWAGRRTARNEVMYKSAGIAYVYICYGMHHLFNVVTNDEEIPHAILIRAVEPLLGVDTMLKRTGKKQLDRTLTSGPGNVAKALGISVKDSGLNLLGDKIYIADDGFKYSPKQIAEGPRIGVESAGDHALLPYRYYVRGNQFVSGKRN
ncbi:MAG: DNA-3-methyladenine glycosylase [Bacteroidetes bacterium]|nr:MAG: DNA-3-methyladenine glycosylase [Bacteroidota bacterium]